MAVNANQKAVTAVDMAVQEADKIRANAVAGFGISIRTYRNDVNLQDIFARAREQHVEPWQREDQYYPAGTVIGTATINQQVISVQSEPNDGIKRLLCVSVNFLSLAATDVLAADLNTLMGMQLRINLQIGKPVILPFSRILNCGFETPDGTQGMIPSGPMRELRTTADKPFAIIVPGDNWNAEITNANGGTITAGALAAIFLGGDKLVAN